MRIVGGRHRGRSLLGPADRRIRPTSDRAREALFDLLEHRVGVRASRFLDVCAGSGAVGLEAYSRGAADVLLIESDPQAIRLIHRNLARLGDPAEVRVLEADATRLTRAAHPHDIAFVDPPYGTDLAPRILNALASGWLTEEALVVVECGVKEAVDVPAPLRVTDERRYGAARFIVMRAA